MTAAPIRIGVTVGSLARDDGGPSQSVPALCRALESAGVRTDIVTCETPGQSESNSSDLTVHSVKYASRRARAAWGAPFRRRLLDVVKRERLELLHDNGVWLQTNHATASVARRLSLPFIMSPRGMLEPWSLRHRSWKKRLAWLLFQRHDLYAASVVHATSVMEAEGLRGLGVRGPIAVIPNGVTIPTVDVNALWQARSKAFPRTALFLSRVHPKKGLLDLVRAWADLRPAGWRVVIAGPDEGGHRANVERLVREAGLQNDILFVGAVRGEAKRALFREAHVFVLPTHSENFGIVVAEALGYGLPVITTKGAPWRDLITERCGWWTNVGATALEAALGEATLMTCAELAVMGERARAYVERTYSWTRAAQQMREVYLWTLGRGPRPDSILHDDPNRALHAAE